MNRVLRLNRCNRITFIQQKIEDKTIEIIFTSDSIIELKFFISLEKRQFDLLVGYLIQNLTLSNLQLSFPKFIQPRYLDQMKKKIIHENITLERLKFGNENIIIEENKRIKELFSLFEKKYSFPERKNDKSEVIILKDRNFQSLIEKHVSLPVEIIHEIFSYIPEIKMKTLLKPFLFWVQFNFPKEKKVITKLKRKLSTIEKKPFLSKSFSIFKYIFYGKD